MAGYLIANIEVKDPVKFEEYRQKVVPVIQKFGGRYLVRSQKFEVPEGSSRARQVVVEFPDYASALACYHSPEY